jgi:hypothetical protein
MYTCCSTRLHVTVINWTQKQICLYFHLTFQYSFIVKLFEKRLFSMILTADTRIYKCQVTDWISLAGSRILWFDIANTKDKIPSKSHATPSLISHSLRSVYGGSLIALHAITCLLDLRNYEILLDLIVVIFYINKTHEVTASTGGDVRPPANSFIENYSTGLKETLYPLRTSILITVEWLIWMKCK